MTGVDTLRAVRVTFSYETYIDVNVNTAEGLENKGNLQLQDWNEGRYPFVQELLIHAVATILGIDEYNRGDSTRIKVEYLDESPATSVNGVVVPV